MRTERNQLPERHEPRLVRGEVRHKRMQPFVHAFRYRAFYIQLPLKSLQANQRLGSSIRVGGLGWAVNKRSLLSVHDRDHGDGRPLLQWALDVLHRSGIHDADGEIWLQTFPRMLGYVFKPVSFWFCERADGSLRAVIAEVNNTFGDRHVYVLQSKGINGFNGSDGLNGHKANPSIHNGETLGSDKAFYVSPFFQVQGRYRFRFFKTGLGGHDVARIEYENETGALLLTSMSGVSSRLTQGAAVMTWLTFPLFSVSVIARIHWQALLLWLKGAKFVAREQT